MILLCIGTRPEYIKIKPLISNFKENGIEYITLFTGQHNSLLDGLEFDYRLILEDDLDNSRLNSLFHGIIKSADKLLQNIKPNYVLVQGDTTTAAAMAITAFNLGIKIIHLEAGLRTYDSDNPFPEEINRQLISRISKIHLCPTENNKKNLLDEKVAGDIFVTGNTSLDNIREVKTKDDKIIVVTLHRRENHEKIKTWFEEIEKLASLFIEYKFILPIHPNPNVSKYSGLLKYVNVINPLPHNEMINLIARCSMIITDSGGIQEESSFLNKKSIICRKITERTESLGQSGFICNEPENLIEIFKIVLNSNISGNCPYGDGYSSQRITKIIKEYEGF